MPVKNKKILANKRYSGLPRKKIPAPDKMYKRPTYFTQYKRRKNIIATPGETYKFPVMDKKTIKTNKESVTFAKASK